MKIDITVNLGNYENIKIESSEFDEAKDCYRDIRHALVIIQDKKVDTFIKKYVDPAIIYEVFGTEKPIGEKPTGDSQLHVVNMHVVDSQIGDET